MVGWSLNHNILCRETLKDTKRKPRGTSRGVTNKKTKVTLSRYEALSKQYGVDPLEYLFIVIADRQERYDDDSRIRAAVAAAKYGHAQLQTIKVEASVDLSGEVEVLWQASESRTAPATGKPKPTKN